MTVYRSTVTPDMYTHIRDYFLQSLTADEFHAVDFYTSSGYRMVNKYMMDANVFDEKRTQESYEDIIGKLQNALKRAEPGVTIPTLYRGTKQKHVSSLAVGDVYIPSFFFSTTTDPVVASRFAGETEPAVIVIENVNRNYGGVSWMSQENEVLLPASSRFVITSIEKNQTFQPEFENSGFYAPAKKNVTIVKVVLEENCNVNE